MVIYLTENNINGKKYIGKDSKNDTSYLGSGIHLKRALKKYGRENFTKIILEECETIDDLNDRERYWIKKYNAVKSKNYYNISDGGDGGYVISGYSEDELKNYKEKLSNSLKGKIVSVETRLKLSENMKGTVHNSIVKDKISNSVKKLWENDEYREKMIDSAKNRKHNPPCSEATKKKISEATKGKNKGNTPWNKGIKTLQETLDKMSLSMKGKLVGENNPSFGKKWLNKDGKNVYAKKEEINKYIELGYKLGMVKKTNK